MSAPPGFAQRSHDAAHTAHNNSNTTMQAWTPAGPAGFGGSGGGGSQGLGGGSLSSSHAAAVPPHRRAFDDAPTILTAPHSSFAQPAASDSWIGGAGSSSGGVEQEAPFGGRGFSEAHAQHGATRSFAPHAAYEQMQQQWGSGDMSMQAQGAQQQQQDTLFDRTTSDISDWLRRQAAAPSGSGVASGGSSAHAPWASSPLSSSSVMTPPYLSTQRTGESASASEAAAAELAAYDSLGLNIDSPATPSQQTTHMQLTHSTHAGHSSGSIGSHGDLAASTFAKAVPPAPQGLRSYSTPALPPASLYSASGAPRSHQQQQQHHAPHDDTDFFTSMRGSVGGGGSSSGLGWPATTQHSQHSSAHSRFSMPAQLSPSSSVAATIQTSTAGASPSPSNASSIVSPSSANGSGILQLSSQMANLEFNVHAAPFQMDPSRSPPPTALNSSNGGGGGITEFHGHGIDSADEFGALAASIHSGLSSLIEWDSDGDDGDASDDEDDSASDDDESSHPFSGSRSRFSGDGGASKLGGGYGGSPGMNIRRLAESFLSGVDDEDSLTLPATAHSSGPIVPAPAIGRRGPLSSQPSRMASTHSSRAGAFDVDSSGTALSSLHASTEAELSSRARKIGLSSNAVAFNQASIGTFATNQQASQQQQQQPHQNQAQQQQYSTHQQQQQLQAQIQHLLAQQAAQQSPHSATGSGLQFPQRSPVHGSQPQDGSQLQLHTSAGAGGRIKVGHISLNARAAVQQTSPPSSLPRHLKAQAGLGAGSGKSSRGLDGRDSGLTSPISPQPSLGSSRNPHSVFKTSPLLDPSGYEYDPDREAPMVVGGLEPVARAFQTLMLPTQGNLIAMIEAAAGGDEAHHGFVATAVSPNPSSPTAAAALGSPSFAQTSGSSLLVPIEAPRPSPPDVAADQKSFSSASLGNASPSTPTAPIPPSPGVVFSASSAALAPALRAADTRAFNLLHNHIISFTTSMHQLQVGALRLREELACRTRWAVRSVWPQAIVSVVGSVCAGVALPKSDLDFVIYFDQSAGAGAQVHDQHHQQQQPQSFDAASNRRLVPGYETHHLRSSPNGSPSPSPVPPSPQPPSSPNPAASPTAPLFAHAGSLIKLIGGRKKSKLLFRSTKIQVFKDINLIRLRDGCSGISMDLWFPLAVDIHRRSQQHTSLIHGWMASFPAFYPLSCVVKTFMQQNLLNSGYSGLGSYGILLMIVRFLQQERRKCIEASEREEREAARALAAERDGTAAPPPSPPSPPSPSYAIPSAAPLPPSPHPSREEGNLGRLLCRFFRFYMVFDFENWGLDVRAPSGSFFDKTVINAQIRAQQMREVEEMKKNAAAAAAGERSFTDGGGGNNVPLPLPSPTGLVPGAEKAPSLPRPAPKSRRPKRSDQEDNSDDEGGGGMGGGDDGGGGPTGPDDPTLFSNFTLVIQDPQDVGNTIICHHRALRNMIHAFHKALTILEPLEPPPPIPPQAQWSHVSNAGAAATSAGDSPIQGGESQVSIAPIAGSGVDAPGGLQITLPLPRSSTSESLAAGLAVTTTTSPASASGSALGSSSSGSTTVTATTSPLSAASLPRFQQLVDMSAASMGPSQKPCPSSACRRAGENGGPTMCPTQNKVCFTCGYMFVKPGVPSEQHKSSTGNKRGGDRSLNASASGTPMGVDSMGGTPVGSPNPLHSRQSHQQSKLAQQLMQQQGQPSTAALAAAMAQQLRLHKGGGSSDRGGDRGLNTAQLLSLVNMQQRQLLAQQLQAASATLLQQNASTPVSATRAAEIASLLQSVNLLTSNGSSGPNPHGSPRDRDQRQKRGGDRGERGSKWPKGQGQGQGQGQHAQMMMDHHQRHHSREYSMEAIGGMQQQMQHQDRLSSSPPLVSPLANSGFYGHSGSPPQSSLGLGQPMPLLSMPSGGLGGSQTPNPSSSRIVERDRDRDRERGDPRGSPGEKRGGRPERQSQGGGGRHPHKSSMGSMTPAAHQTIMHSFPTPSAMQATQLQQQQQQTSSSLLSSPRGGNSNAPLPSYPSLGASLAPSRSYSAAAPVFVPAGSPSGGSTSNAGLLHHQQQSQQSQQQQQPQTPGGGGGGSSLLFYSPSSSSSSQLLDRSEPPRSSPYAPPPSSSPGPNPAAAPFVPGAGSSGSGFNAQAAQSIFQAHPLHLHTMEQQQQQQHGGQHAHPHAHSQTPGGGGHQQRGYRGGGDRRKGPQQQQQQPSGARTPY